MHTVYLGLGSNLGDRRAIIINTIKHINNKIGKVIKKSSLIETAPWGYNSTNKFLNACICVQTKLSPQQLLDTTQEIELLMGRTNKSINGIYEDRTIDIDILLYDDLKIDKPNLKIPHPLMKKREFVMKPLDEIRKIV